MWYILPLEENPSLPPHERFPLDFTSGAGLEAWMSVTLYIPYTVFIAFIVARIVDSQ